MNPKSIEEAVTWYAKNRDQYENLAKKVESIIIEVLNRSKVNYFTVSSRAKDIKSYEEKAGKEKYINPIDEIMDMAGIRVITFVKSDVEQCCEIIKPLFNIDSSNSVDKGEELGIDKMGYRSVHFIAELSDDRLKLPEYMSFKSMRFEIQIRTILEHSWADISHDKNYKFQGVLPTEIQRRFSLISATLELVDREFDSIAHSISTYGDEIKKKSKTGLLDIDINTTSLREYLEIKLKKEIENSLITPNFGSADSEIIEELDDFGIAKLNDLGVLIDTLATISTRSNNNFTSYLRSRMMLKDIKRYFTSSWKGHWKGLNSNTYNFLKKQDIDIDKYLRMHNIDILD